MQRAVCVLLLVLTGWSAQAVAQSPQAPDQRVADLVRAGKVRVGLHLPQFVKDPVTGEIKGLGTGAVIEQIAHALADRLGVELQLVGHPSPPALIECLKAEACDVGFLGFVPGRTTDVSFAPPHMFVPFTYLVPAGSSIGSVNDVDRPGTRIAVVRSHASTLMLSRLLKHAETIAVEIPDEAFELLRSGKVNAWAAPRPPLLEYSAKLAGSHVLPDRYGENIQAIAVPKGQPARLAFVSEFVEQAKASGLLQQAIARAGERGMEVAPADDSVLTGSTPAARAR